MNKKYLLIILLIAVIGLVLMFVFFKKSLPFPIDSNPVVLEDKSTYVSEEFGFSFEYPSEYMVEERENNTTGRRHTSLVLLSKGYIPPIGGEGPTTVSFDIYRYDSNSLSLENWVTSSRDSNFKLGNQIHTETEVDGTRALTFSWDGLYRGRTAVFMHSGNVIAVSGTYFEVTDKIYYEYDDLISSIKLSEPMATPEVSKAVVENYLKENISDLSPEKEVLGGKFYITEVVLTDNKSGVVSYEDGHIALVADFTYSVSLSGALSIDTFVIRD